MLLFGVSSVVVAGGCAFKIPKRTKVAQRRVKVVVFAGVRRCCLRAGTWQLRIKEPVCPSQLSSLRHNMRAEILFLSLLLSASAFSPLLPPHSSVSVLPTQGLRSLHTQLYLKNTRSISFRGVRDRNGQQVRLNSDPSPSIMPDGGLSPCVIKVVGVGGGGSNAVDRMMETRVEGVEFWAVNTDAQALGRSKAKGARVLNIGGDVTRGLGGE